MLNPADTLSLDLINEACQKATMTPMREWKKPTRAVSEGGVIYVYDADGVMLMMMNEEDWNSLKS